MLSADAADTAAMSFDPDPIGDEGYGDDNLSIDVANIWSILEEDPVPIQAETFLGTSQCVYQDEVTPGQVDHAKAYESKAELSTVEDFRGEHPQRILDTSDFERGMECDFPLEAERDYNTSDEGSLPYSQHLYSRSFHSLPLQHSSDWLTPSCSNNNVSMGSFGGHSGSYFPSNSGHQLITSNHPVCSIQREKPLGQTSQDYEQPHREFYFQPEQESKPYIDKISPSYIPQNGAGSSNYLSTGNYNGGLPKRNYGALTLSKAENGNLYPSHSVYSYMNSDAPFTGQVQLEAKTSQLTNLSCDGTVGLTLPREYPSEVMIVTDQEIPNNYHPVMMHGYESADSRGNQLLSQNSCRTSEVKLGAQEESPNNSFTEVSVTDLDALPDEQCSEQDYSDDSSLISESSTDSSPIPSSRNFGSGSVGRSAANALEKLSDLKTIFSSKIPRSEIKNEWKDQSFARHVPVGCNPTFQRNPHKANFKIDDDSEVCILDDIRDHSSPSGLPFVRKLQPSSQFSGFNNHHPVLGGMRLRPDDEKLSFQKALQDLSQPLTEASPPDGVLAVPLLRHQRIALSWMVQKETAAVRSCTGGILADDQGLGKTISTIALILTERSPSSKSSPVLEEQDECEALNLDDDDYSNHPEVSLKKSWNSMPNVLNRFIKNENSVNVVKGRPQAGTLVVCPTSVLRQWADELQNKVTSKANLSYLVYHGGNRTKDPYELAKYDVVLTTYAIVSMEVPKQPLVDKGEEDRGKQDASCVPDEMLNNKKRKISNSKSRNNTLPESSVRPLGRVGWFRVVLDEAQSIKNHRTQVARACWGLRAKRRWCLSGTPIQNAIDDLYSYFRFLRFELFEKYHSFCSGIKAPINKDPGNGYKKLQAVLKMVMLRRTKGTLLDGKPIINLPPKTVSLKKVTFSNEERSFYQQLEAESQEQFKEYADAGTVKQNYVNILLMLLRLRQACDHRLLVKGCDSISSQNSSMETAKKLPRDKTANLLSCLETSLAICTICNDAPEDSVVTICGHVYCNQCICEHLTGDESICPSLNCKTQLSVSSIFSRGTLKSCLSDQLGHGCLSGTPGFEVKQENNRFEDRPSYPLSSKIKAALEILQSLPNVQVSPQSDGLKSGGVQDDSVISLKPDPVRTLVDSSDAKDKKFDKCSGSRISEKAIVFSQWTRMLDLLEAPLKASSIQYRRLDGTMSVTARERAIRDFNTRPEVTVMIMSLKAASLGLNMVAACHVLLLDLWWNPTTEDQAIDRAHRIGQIRPVTVSRLTVEHTVEDRILSLQEKKREMVASAFGEDDSGTRQTRLTEEDLRYLFMV